MITERHQCLFCHYCFYRVIFNSLWIHSQVFFFKCVFTLGCAPSSLQYMASLWWRLLPWAGALDSGLLGFRGAAPRLRSTCLVVVARGLRCPLACGSSQVRDWTCVSCTDRLILSHWAIRGGLPPPPTLTPFFLKLGDYRISPHYRLRWWDWQTTQK